MTTGRDETRRQGVVPDERCNRDGTMVAQREAGGNILFLQHQRVSPRGCWLYATPATKDIGELNKGEIIRSPTGAAKALLMLQPENTSSGEREEIL